MKKFFIVVCFFATIFDGVASMLGFCVAEKTKTIPGYFFALIGALIVVALTLSAKDVWGNRDAFHRHLKPFWLLAFLVNIGTVGLAACNHIILGRALTDSTTFDWQQVRTAGLLERGTIFVMTIFLTGAPIVVSHLWQLLHEEEDEEVRKPIGGKKAAV